MAVMDTPGLSEEQREFYSKNGYLIIENVLDPIGLDQVVEAYERTEAKLKPAWEQSLIDGTYGGGYGNGPNAHTMRPDFSEDPIFLDVANNPLIIPLVANIVGPDYQVMEMCLHNHHAGTEAHTGWHRDWPAWTHPQYTLKAKVFYFLDDQDPDMGCFSLVPDTHKLPDGPTRGEYTGSTLEDMPNFKKMDFKADLPSSGMCCAGTRAWPIPVRKTGASSSLAICPFLSENGTPARLHRPS